MKLNTPKYLTSCKILCASSWVSKVTKPYLNKCINYLRTLHSNYTEIKNFFLRMGHDRNEHFCMVDQYAKFRRIIHSLTLSPPLKVRGLKEKKKNKTTQGSWNSFRPELYARQERTRDLCSGLQIGCNIFQFRAVVSL